MSVNWTNVTTPGDLLAVPNTNTGGNFWLAIIFMVWVVLIIAFLGIGFEGAILVASFIALVASLFLVYMNLVAWQWSLFFLGFIIFMILYIVWSSSKDQ